MKLLPGGRVNLN